MNWDDLRYVLEVARSGSVTAAAKRLGVAHTTVYRRIQALEQSQTEPLFERRGAAYEPTGAARALVDLAMEIEARVVLLERATNAEMSGEVRITTVAPFAERFGASLASFRALHPNIRLVLRVTNDLLSVERGEADVALRVTRAPPEQLVGRKVGDVRFAIFGAAEALPSEPDDLFDLDWIGLDETLAATPQGRWENDHLRPERVIFRTNSRPLFVDLVRRGLGLGVLPCAIGAEGQSLRPLSPPLDELTLPVWLLTHDHLRRTPRVRAVLDFFADALAEVRDDL